MLPDQLLPSGKAFSGLQPGICGLVGVLFAAMLTVGSCSTMPEPSYPPHQDHRFDASFLIGDVGKLPFLVTSTNVVLHRLELDPKPDDELFGGDARWFVYPPGTTVKVRGALRAYATHDGKIPSLKDLLQTSAARMTSLITF
jgi:hypothetical protein